MKRTIKVRAVARKSSKAQPAEINVGAIPDQGKNKGNIPIDLAELEKVHPDTIDFRDKMYVPTLVEVPSQRSVDEYLASYNANIVPANVVLDQQKEGACTGFGLAAVANYLLWTRRVVPDREQVSPRMFYEMARRYDEWPGEKYSGSSARGAMKGWHKHGVCSRKVWPYQSGKPGSFDVAKAQDAARRPLGAYFRVNHEDLVSMHSAIAETGILYATASVHEGWGQVGADGVIPLSPNMLGGHAFAIVGYDREGFWIQNSWGPGWGKNGFALISYDDWLANGTDVWVARLGAPVQLKQPSSGAKYAALNRRSEFSFSELRPHIVSIGNDGALRPDGMFGTSEEDVRNLVADMKNRCQSWGKKRVLLYAHGGLVSEENALQRVEEYRQALLDSEVYPVAFIWKTDLWTTLKNILDDALSRRKPEGLLDAAKDFMLDRLDDTLEPIARPIGKPIWSEMKENAVAASGSGGGAKYFIDTLVKALSGEQGWEIHVAGHSAGSIFMGAVVPLLAGHGLTVKSLALWAPACTIDFFEEYYVPALKKKNIERFTLFTLKDAAEQDDHCGHIYNKSLLYLVSNALEEKSGLFFLDGEPLLGMEDFIFERTDLFKVPDKKKVLRDNPPVVDIMDNLNAEWVRSPNGLPKGESPNASHAREHGGFDDDPATVISTLWRILDQKPVLKDKPVKFYWSAEGRKDCRRRLSGEERP